MPDLQPYQQRVVTERDELNEKIVKLESFFSTLKFQELSADEQGRLALQSVFMRRYYEVLDARIQAF